MSIKLFKNKKILIMALVAILGWAGFTVSEQNVAQVVDVLIVDDKTAETAPSSTLVPNLEENATSHISSEATVKEDFNAASAITSERRTHILYGDATGGGHKFGTGAPCKSEFPKHWDDKTIIKEIELIAANDNLNWEQQRNGYYVTEQKVGTVKVRVVKGRDNKNVITAYPTNTQRNPCPVNDNY